MTGTIAERPIRKDAPFDIAAKQRERGDSGTGVDDLISADGSTAGNLLVYHQIYCLVRARFHQSAAGKI